MAKILAPLGGWNTRDPISAMGSGDAIEMVNLIPDIDGVSIRPAYTEYVDLAGDRVNSLVQWKTQFGERLLAADRTGSNHRLYDITTGSASSIKTGFVKSKWDHIVFNGQLGIVNGGDYPQRLTYAPGPGVQIFNMNISGLTYPEKFSIIHAHKERSYFATGDEPAFWYSDTEVLGGTLTRFPIDRVSLTGGNVIEISTWSRDGGSGPDDYFVLFLDTGEILVYQGSDPSDSSNWAIVGRFEMGRVLAATEFGGKIHCVTDQDYNVFPDDLLTQGLRRPTKLTGAAKKAVQRDQTDNWQIIIDPVLGWRLSNVPYGSNREQHLLNLRSGGGCKTDYPAQVWSKFRGGLYFGATDGKVYKIEDSDNSATQITWSVQQAYTDFGSERDKYIKAYRPIWTTKGTLTYDSGLAYDYGSIDFWQSATIQSSGPPWDTSSWDTTSWGTGNPSKKDWLAGAGGGQNVSIRQHGVSTKRATWHHTDYLIEVAQAVV